MTRHLRTLPVRLLLARLGTAPSPIWTVPCRDGHGRRAQLHIRLTTRGISITPSGTGPWSLTALDAGRLRGAVRHAFVTPDARP